MNILVLGSGGREHALVWKISQSPRSEKIFSIPGNPGIEQYAECKQMSLSDFEGISDFIKVNNIDLTVVGPEQPLVAGITDFLEQRGHLVFGPKQKAAQLEGSKIFAKNFMERYKIPTASFGTFKNYDKALTFLESLKEGPVVVKADGLAAGKGSIVCPDHRCARTALRDMMVDKKFYEAGSQVVIEEFMAGEETSLFVITDGSSYKILSPAQDYKRALDGDKGKNTGGMGSYAPSSVFSKALLERTIREIVEPVLSGLKFEGIDYRGILYIGLMITKSGPKVVEFNVRFGDPETQVVLPLLETDLADLLAATARGELEKQPVKLKEGAAVCVIAASGGYPNSYEKDKIITGLGEAGPEVMVFQAGTRKIDNKIVTNGGRVLGITAWDTSLKTAINKVYSAAEKIHFDGMHYRKDIASRAIKNIE